MVRVEGWVGDSLGAGLLVSAHQTHLATLSPLVPHAFHPALCHAALCMFLRPARLQFYITFTPTPHLDGKHVVFGAVEAGWSTLMMMEGAGSDAGNTNTPVTIVDCR